MAYARRIPLLILAEPGVKRQGMLSDRLEPAKSAETELDPAEMKVGKLWLRSPAKRLWGLVVIAHRTMAFQAQPANQPHPPLPRPTRRTGKSHNGTLLSE